MTKPFSKMWQKNRFPIFFMFFSLIGLLGSLMISIEKEHLLKNPATDLSCSINPVYSCQSVITSPQASILGFSNEYIGLALYAGLLAIGLSILAGGVFKKWLHALVWTGLLGSMGIVLWFFYQSVYVIEALCIYCTSVWLATWTLFVGYSHWLLTTQAIQLPPMARPAERLFKRYAPVVWFGIIVLVVGLILNHFWYYYGQYF